MPLPPDTEAAWGRYVEAVEQRLEAERRDGGPFLSVDRRASAAADRRALQRGAVLIESAGAAEDDERLRVPEGRVHHWRGTVFIPDVTLDTVIRRLETEPPDPRQEDIVESRVLETAPGRMRVFIKLRRSKIITAYYNTEHEVRFERIGETRAASRSVATRIAELADAGTPREREKDTSDDRGFLWRGHAYWRYEAWRGGVIAECESVSLSRTVPRLLAPLIGPIVTSTARESMDRTLRALRERFREGQAR